MRLKISIPPEPSDVVRRFLRASSPLFYCILILAFMVCVRDRQSPGAVWKTAEIVLLLAGLAVVWRGSGGESRSSRGIQYFLLAAFLISIFDSWIQIPFVDAIYLYVILAAVAAAAFGAADAFLLVGTATLLSIIAGPGNPGLPQSRFAAEIALQTAMLSLTALAVSYLGASQRRTILALREDLQSARSARRAFFGGDPDVLRSSFTAAPEQPAVGMESLEESFQKILRRIRVYFRAHSVLLYQPCGDRSLMMRHAVSESSGLLPANLQDIDTTFIGRVFARGVSCNLNLEEAHSQITGKDLPYYSEWQPVKHLAACPLKAGGSVYGVLIVDRTNSLAFSELEVIHLETFAVQLVEMIQMGKRYLEQVDQNTEYRLFYHAMSELGQSLATQEVLETLASVSQGVITSTHLLIALLDPSGLSYELAYASGAESLKGAKVRSQGRTWISWMLNSDSGPLLLRDIGSHPTKMPVAVPSEENLSIRSVLMIPLVAKGEKLGILLLGSTGADYYQNWHMRIMTSICRQAAASIENSLLHRRVADEALSDGLTHLHNHRYFQERLKSECSRTRRNNASLSLLMMDIDRFKGVNDTFGHRVGDMILQRMASILKASVRSEDAVARYGGEEFVAILTDSKRKGALRMAERSRHAVEQVSFFAEGHQIRLSISIGTATFPDDADMPWELVERADQALYAAKEQGRNRVVQYHTLAQQPPKMHSVG